MTSGRDRESGVWSPTEDFFWDDEFRDFLRFYASQAPSTLVINGDLFDFLKVLVFPTPEQMRTYGISESDIDRTYGLRSSEPAATFQVDKIIDGHPTFFQSLAEFMAAGNSVIILKGNHDIQLFWNAVRERVYSRLEDLLPRNRKKVVREKLSFLPWCFYVPNLLYVEHGNQYEYTTSFRNFLNPQLPINYPGTGRQIELDLSGFLVRYVLNRLKPIDPLSDSIRPQSQYLQAFWTAHPFLFVTTIGTTIRYILKAFSKARQLSSGPARRAYGRITGENSRMIREEAARFAGKSPAKEKALERKFFMFDDRKAEPVLTSGPWRFLWNEIRTPLSGLAVALVLYAVSIVPDFNGMAERAISTWPHSFWRSVIEGLIALKVPQIGAVAILAMLLIFAYTKIRSKRKGHGSGSLDITRKIREHARVIARELDVPYVTFGHTHYADIHRCSDRSWYFNTGTWMTIFSPEEQIYRDAHQFTFLKVDDDAAELLRWNPDRKGPQPVHVVDTEPVQTDVEDGIFTTLIAVLSGR